MTSTPTTPPTLTATQTRALLHALLSSNPNPNTTHRAPSSSAAPKPAARSPRQSHHQSQPVQTHNITIDASTRIMGHGNNIHVSSPSPTEQAARINDLVRGALASVSTGNGAVNVTVNAGVNMMGSKNVIVLGSSANHTEAVAKKDVESGSSSPMTRGEGSGSGRKRRADDLAENDETEGKKMKFEGGSKERVEA